jgi:hypothetical protein
VPQTPWIRCDVRPNFPSKGAPALDGKGGNLPSTRPALMTTNGNERFTWEDLDNVLVREVLVERSNRDVRGSGDAIGRPG